MGTRTATYFYRFLTSERGASLAEYGLVVLLIAIVALVAVATVGEEVSGQYSYISSEITDARGG